MLFMVVERFRPGRVAAIGDRFRREGRMLPEGVVYQASWIDEIGGRCFQVMEAPRLESLKPWVDAWQDLVDFEIVPVVTSSEFWRRMSDPA